MAPGVFVQDIGLHISQDCEAATEGESKEIPWAPGQRNRNRTLESDSSRRDATSMENNVEAKSLMTKLSVPVWSKFFRIAANPSQARARVEATKIFRAAGPESVRGWLASCSVLYLAGA